MYDGYDLRPTFMTKVVNYTTVQNYSVAADGTAVVFDIVTGDAKPGDEFIRLTVGNFSAAERGRRFRLEPVLMQSDGHQAREPGSRSCRELAAAAAAAIYQKRIANFTAAELCQDLGLCKHNTSALCKDCLSLAETLARYLNEFLPKPEQNLKQIAMSVCDQENRRQIDLGFNTPPSESFFGFGERFDAVDQRGRRLYCWTEDGGWSLGLAPDQRLPKLGTPTETYMPAPFLLSSLGHAMYIDTGLRTHFDLAHTDAAVATTSIEGTALPMLVLLGDTPAESLAMYTAMTGEL